MPKWTPELKAPTRFIQTSALSLSFWDVLRVLKSHPKIYLSQKLVGLPGFSQL